MNNDLISREALKKAISENGYSHYYEIFAIIDNAPTVNDCPNCEYKLESDYIRSSSSYKELIDLRKFKEENTRPHGKWIEDSGNIACSHCHTIWLYRRTDFCPNCGADMRGGAE